MTEIEKRKASYEKYKAVRELKGFDHDNPIAIGSGVTRSTFSDWKMGRSMPKQDKLMRIAKFLKVSIGKLL